MSDQSDNGGIFTGSGTQITVGTMTDADRKLLQRLLSNPIDIPRIFKDWIRRYLEQNPPEWTAADLGLTQAIRMAQSAWLPLTLQNGWGAYGAPFAVPAYAVDASGLVHLRGLLAGAAASSSTIGTLPAGYRTKDQEMFYVQGYNGAYVGARVDVQSSGVIQVVNPTVHGIASSFLSLSGISFQA